MKTDIQYIKENYIELSELSSKTEFSKEEILDLIERNIIPNYSYTIETIQKITSSLSDVNINNKIEKYFAKSHIEKLNKHKTLNLSPEEIKMSFKENFVKILEKHEDRFYAYEGLFNSDEKDLPDLLNNAVETEWKYYCNGIYGICTLNANEKDIVEKEIIVKKLIAFNKEYEDKILNEYEKQMLLKLNEQFNKVTALFSPYQRITSSRGKYLDKILRKNKLDADIKNYS